MAVADGHGSQAYDRSEIGSRLACQVSMEILIRELGNPAAPPLHQMHDWQEWLRHQLPQMIHRHWLQAVEAHRQAQRREPQEPLSPQRYGSTLGLVILTPQWWAAGGVGDWDLVQVSGDGQAQLLNEEPQGFASGEATASLCLPTVASLFADRILLQPIRATSAPFALLLSTDGLRKSCATDADFLALCRYLAQAPLSSGRRDEEVKLEGALDQVTSQGSGDDTSLALAVFGDLNLRGLVGSSRSGEQNSRACCPEPVLDGPLPARGEPPIPWRLGGSIILGSLCLVFGMAAFVLWSRFLEAPPPLERPWSERSSPASQELEPAQTGDPLPKRSSAPVDRVGLRRSAPATGTRSDPIGIPGQR